ncbi:hypothetical protein F3Y22_tig00116995pilonHSYRG00042 [Hibiscus syriacus]|uniref:Uncharacterized protein n=1 Tax=Hibiscus syriacus TaxID=106335 RepID=A0A6A2XG16_HIBSY|nr:hypothetical protein F3Y22_tig00116995pilonHSYRG00042 [Hibiscus syriacus]
MRRGNKRLGTCTTRAGDDRSILGRQRLLWGTLGCLRAPFGSGRRVCPGKAMGLATVHLWLVQLLRAFEWVTCEDDGDALDLTEHLKQSMEMKKSLVCKAIPRVC